MTKHTLTIKEVMLIVIIAILFGVVYKIWGPVYTFANAIAPFLGQIVYPMWFVAGVVAAYIIRKPGVAFLAEFLAASGELLTGSQFGLSMLFTGAMQALGAEIIFLLFRYRRWDFLVLAIASISASLGSIFSSYLISGLGANTGFIQVMTISVRIASSIVVCGAFSKWIADKLVATGSLNSYEIVLSTQKARWEL
ncbi:ECF transporter S component [Lentibacillus halophilus]|uniref:ECF transporter S component n=1 Tax=Lentibacillus halophilus TaxID=295065 RepID=A0ABP3IXM6_9BACI